MKSKIKFLILAVLTVFFCTTSVIAQNNMNDDKKMEMMMMDNMKSWPEASRMAAKEMTEKYGKPNEMTENAMVWYNNGPWMKTIVYKKEVAHNFLVTHQDVMQQFLSYKVDPSKFDELAAFDGSVVVDRTQGELSARCDKEANNMLALNLSYDVIMGKKSVEEAREFYGKTIIMVMKGEKPAYTQKLNFSSEENAEFHDMNLDKMMMNK